MPDLSTKTRRLLLPLPWLLIPASQIEHVHEEQPHSNHQMNSGPITRAQYHQAEKIIAEKLLIAVGAGLLAAYRLTCQLLRFYGRTNGIFQFLIILTWKDSNL